jgi:hypothetical protein
LSLACAGGVTAQNTRRHAVLGGIRVSTFGIELGFWSEVMRVAVFRLDLFPEIPQILSSLLGLRLHGAFQLD